VIDDFSIPHGVNVDDFNLEVLFRRRDANKQATVDRYLTHTTMSAAFFAANDYQITFRK